MKDIKNEVIDIEGSNLSDRLRLRQVLLDNSQKLRKKNGRRPKLVTNRTPPAGMSFKLICTWRGKEEWGTSRSTPTITLEEFVTKYK